jgi:hypothetical protein
MTSLVE